MKRMIGKMNGIKKWFKESLDLMMNSKEGWTCSYDFKRSKDGEQIYSLVLKWCPGFEPNENKYIDENGYGICMALAVKNSSYFTEDWNEVVENFAIYENISSMIKWIRRELRDQNL